MIAVTYEEVRALTNEELQSAAALYHRFERVTTDADGLSGYDTAEPKKHWQLVPDYPNDIAAAMDLFDEIYNKKSPLHGGAWVLGTVSDGKDCSQATLFLHLPWRKRVKKGMKTGKVEKVDKYQATTKVGEMARAITLVYVTAMEDAK